MIRLPKNKEEWRKVLGLLSLCLLLVLSGGIINISYVIMAQRLLGYPVFLTYFPTVIQVALMLMGFIIESAYLKRKSTDTPRGYNRTKTRQYHYYYLWIAVWFTVNGIVGQFADPFVDGDLQAILGTLQIPIVGLCAFIYLKTRLNRLQIFGSVVVIVGVLIGLIPNFISIHQNGSVSAFLTGKNSWFWIIIMILNNFPGAWSFILQETVLGAPYKDQIMRMVFWSNFYSFFGYLLTIPLSSIPVFGQGIPFNQLGQHQLDAFRCFFEMQPLPEKCAPGGWYWIVIFSIGVALNYSVIAVLIENESVYFSYIITALVTPFTAFLFAIRPLVGEQYQPVVWSTFVSAFVIVIGVVIYRISKPRDPAQKRRTLDIQSEDDDHPSEKKAFLRHASGNVDNFM